MRPRKQFHFDLGEPISMEDAISMMTIIFVLFVIFLVPLVSIDKARLENKRVDLFWNEVVDYLGQRSSSEFDKESKAYSDAFNFYNPLAVKTTLLKNGEVQFRYVETILPDSSLMVIRHDLTTDKFSSMRMTKNGETTTFRHGALEEIPSTQHWFPTEDEVDYGTDPRSTLIDAEYRQWRGRSIKGEK